MIKSLLSLFLFIALASNACASEKAFSALISYGLKANDLVEVVKKYPELKDLDITAVNPSIHADLKLYSEDADDVYIVSKNNTEFNVEKYGVQFETEIKVIDGAIRGTLFDTILKETDSESLASQMSEAFKEDFSTTKGLRTNADYSFDIVEKFENGRFIKYGNILKASLVIGHAISKKLLQINPETFAWELLPEDSQIKDKPFYNPVRASRVSSLFQLNRRHPVTRKHQPHNGIDFVAMSGVAVYPALDGEVVVIARSRSKGKYITILHDNGYQTTYIHLKQVQKGLRVGMRVELEDQIGEVGRTGYATGAHLHFGVIKDGYFVNPIYLLKNYCFDQKDQYENLESDLSEKMIEEGDEEDL